MSILKSQSRNVLSVMELLPHLTTNIPILVPASKTLALNSLEFGNRLQEICVPSRLNQMSKTIYITVRDLLNTKLYFSHEINNIYYETSYGSIP